MKREKAQKRTIIKAINIDILKIDFKSKYLRLLNSARVLKERKAELQLAFEEIENIYNNAPCGYYSLDENGTFIRINNTALHWLGEKHEGFTGIKKFTDVLTEASREKFRKSYPVFMKTGYMHDLEFDFVRKNGSTFPVSLNATAIYDERGNYKMSHSVVLDITTRKLMEQELIGSHSDLQQKNDALTVANENLFFLNREKDRFRDIASHDLQLPLVAISMLSETLLKRNIPSGSSEEKQVFEMIHDASLEMKALLANTLSASLSETGHMDLFLSEIDINKLTNDIVNRYIPIAHKKNIQIHFKNNKNFLLHSDRECCTQIIENLLSNAVKYTPHAKNVTVAITGNQKEAKIIIADEGPGIKKEDRHLLFQRFQKLSARPTGGELSTGLGLSIVKYLVAQIKGNITVESEFGKGSVFTVHLPLSSDI
ncbi:MAG: PAS domain-containing sensor histidine kinase [Bacteroidota bacterium]